MAGRSACVGIASPWCGEDCRTLRATSIGSLNIITVSLLFSAATAGLADTHVERATRPRRVDASVSRARAESRDLDTSMEAAQLQRVVDLTNLERLKAGLPALQRQPNLQESATWMAQDMAERNYFSHQDSGGRSMSARIIGFRYSDYRALGENIAMGQRTPEEVVEAWMKSPGHRANILSPKFSEIGVGFIRATDRSSGGGYWVQDFGGRFDQCLVVIDTDCARTSASSVKLSIHGDEHAQQMRFSNDGARWTGWEAYRPLRDWSLEPGSGRRMVYTEVRQSGRVERYEAGVTVEGQSVALHTIADAGNR